VTITGGERRLLMRARLQDEAVSVAGAGPLRSPGGLMEKKRRGGGLPAYGTWVRLPTVAPAA